MSNETELALRLRNAVAEGDDIEASRATEEALAAGMSPLALVNGSIQDALNEVGAKFEVGDLYLPELILAGDAAAAALAILKPHLSTGQTDSRMGRGKVVIGTIQGDLHDIGKNVVGALLSANGVEVVDLGTDVTPRKYIEAAKREGANIIAISTLLTTSLPFHREIVRLLQDMHMRNDYFVIVGGGPVNADWAEKIGADGYGRDAHDAVKLCRYLISEDVKPPLAKPITFGALQGVAQ